MKLLYENTYKVYLCDNDHLLNECDTCLIRLEGNNSYNGYDTVLLKSSISKLSICCRIKQCNDIGNNDVIVKPWILIVLGINHGDIINIELLTSKCPKNINKKCNISLEYFGYLCFKHWDENNHNDNWQFMKCYSYLSSLPSKFNINTLKLLLPSLIHGKNLMINSIVSINVLDAIVLFNVSLNNSNYNYQFDYALSIHNISAISLELIIPDKLLSSDNNNQLNHISKNYVTCSYSSTLLEKLYLLCDINIFRNNDYSIKKEYDLWNGSKSILINGPEGSGKTTILECVRDYANKLSQLNCQNQYNIIFLSAENTLDYSSNKYKQIDSINGNDLNGDDEIYLKNIVENLLILLGGTYTQQTIDDKGLKPTLILIDNMNQILLASNQFDQGMGSEAMAKGGMINYQIASVYLRRLLTQINYTKYSNRKILIIGTTSLPLSTIYSINNIPNFDTYMNIPRPSLLDRQVLLSRMLAQTFMENNDLHKIIELTNLTRGYLPGDLAAVVRRIVSTHSKGDLGLDWSKVLSAVASMPPKQLQALDMLSGNGFGLGSSDVKSLCWDDFAGYNEIKKKLIKILSSKKIAKIQTSNLPSGILLHGPAGCGKTYLAKVIAAESKANFVYVRSTEILSKYFGQTEETLRKLFEKARAAAPCVLFFDEFDSLAFKRGLSGDQSCSDAGHSLHNRVLSTFLNEMDGISSLDNTNTEGGVLVLAACNDIDSIDEGLLRPGRFQYHIQLNPPNPNDITDILERYLSKMNKSSDISVPNIVSAFLIKNDSPTAADIGSLCKAAIFVALHEAIEMSSNQNSSCIVAEICNRHFFNALND